MAKHPTRLRENPNAAHPDATIIDARYKVVGKKGVWHAIQMGLLAIACAIALGLATPFAAILAIELLKR